jgi:hypothetical protein
MLNGDFKRKGGGVEALGNTEKNRDKPQSETRYPDYKSNVLLLS